MLLILLLSSGIALANPEGKEARCSTPGTREEAEALMRAMPEPKDLGALGALTAIYNLRRISLAEYCARRYELAGYARRLVPGASAGEQTFTSSSYGWSISYPANWKLDPQQPADVRIQSPDGSALCGIHSGEVRFKTLDEFADFSTASTEKFFKERNVMLTGTGKRPQALPNGVSAVEVITDMSNGGRSRRVYVLAEPVGYLIDCETYTGAWEKLEPVFARIIASLTFRKP